MTNVIEMMTSLYPVSDDTIQLLKDNVTLCHFPKKYQLIKANQYSRSAYFIEKGMTRQFYYKYDKDRKEPIAYEGGLVICLESYLKQEPTRLMIESLEPVILWELYKEDFERLALEHADIGLLYRKFFEGSLIESQIKADTLRFEPAHERYNKLLHLHPEILKRAPLIYIASLLQMTPETLSRVRSSSLNG